MNEKAFTPEEVEQGLLKDLLDYLLDYNKKSQSDYYDIHITSDSYCTIVQWVDVHYNNDYGEGKFEFVDNNHVLAYNGEFPDCHSELCYDEEDYEERLEEFLKEHNYKKNEYGMWEEKNNDR